MASRRSASCRARWPAPNQAEPPRVPQETDARGSKELTTGLAAKRDEVAQRKPSISLPGGGLPRAGGRPGGRRGGKTTPRFRAISDREAASPAGTAKKELFARESESSGRSARPAAAGRPQRSAHPRSGMLPTNGRRSPAAPARQASAIVRRQAPRSAARSPRVTRGRPVPDGQEDAVLHGALLGRVTMMRSSACSVSWTMAGICSSMRLSNCPALRSSRCMT